MEPSEIMTANALRWSNTATNNLSAIKGYNQLTDLIDDAAAYHKKSRINSGAIQFADGKTQTQARKALDYSIKTLKTEAKVTTRVADMAVGVSAAIAIRSYMGIADTKSVIVYTTGDKWPVAVNDFKVDAFGFSSYNSSDLIVTADNVNFFGISLKKKKTVKAPDPTLINKAFASAFVISEADNKEAYDEFQILKEDLTLTKTNYFADIVIDAVEGIGTFDGKPIIAKKDIKNFTNLKKNNDGKQELFSAKQRDKSDFDRSYIDTKGWVTAPDGYKDNDFRNSLSMRAFVNSRLSVKKNPLWEQFGEIMDAGADIIGEHLINIVLKTQLYKKLKAKDLKGVAFKFALITGIGNITPKRAVNISAGKTIDLKTTLCGLTRIEKKFKGRYRVVQDNAASDKSDAAKVFFKLVKGTSPEIKVLDLQVRYKGRFTPDPQFQGGMSQEFKALLEKECSGGPGG